MQNRSTAPAAVSSVVIMVPPDLDAYDTAMNSYIFEGTPNPAPTWKFVPKVVSVATTTDIRKESAHAAALYIHTQGGTAGAHIDHFQIVDGTAYVVMHMQVDGWAGVSISLAKIKPLVEKTLLQFSDIKEVKFDYPKM